MYLLKVRITLYKNREFVSFIAVWFDSTKTVLTFRQPDGIIKRIPVKEIYKLKVTCFKSTKHTGD